MARRKKAPTKENDIGDSIQYKYAIEERFDDVEDEFRSGRDSVLLDDGPVAKRRRKIEAQDDALQPSDEEVFETRGTDNSDFDDAESAAAISHNNDSEEDTEAQEEEEEEGADQERWGLTSADYYNADLIETEADALDEEKEARRLQQKQLKAITTTDFGLDDSGWTQPEVDTVLSRSIVERLPEETIPIGATSSEQTKILHDRYPEFELLVKDFVELQEVWSHLRNKNGMPKPWRNQDIVARLKLNILTSYLATIAMYFAIVTSTIDPRAEANRITAISPKKVREHAIIDKLVTCKKSWDYIKNIETSASDLLTLSAPEIEKQVEIPAAVTITGVESTRGKTYEPSMDDYQSGSEDELDPRSLSSADRQQKKLDLQSLLAQSLSGPIKIENDFGDEEPLTKRQLVEKSKQKKGLRFYTSQIAQKASRRGLASKQAGGDDDVPRKERLRDKQQRLLLEAEQRGHQHASKNEELGMHSEDDRYSTEDNNYYASLVSASQKKKATKQAKAEAYAEAIRQGGQVYESEQVGADGKRKITYAIEKNKGLAPKRKKDVRNPRVKKRKKYDEKLKKLGSIRQVYKGGEGRGGYGGELTGIKTNIIKSVKL